MIILLQNYQNKWGGGGGEQVLSLPPNQRWSTGRKVLSYKAIYITGIYMAIEIHSSYGYKQGQWVTDRT